MQRTKTKKYAGFCITCGHSAEKHTTQQCTATVKREYEDNNSSFLVLPREVKEERTDCDCDDPLIERMLVSVVTEEE